MAGLHRNIFQAGSLFLSDGSKLKGDAARSSGQETELKRPDSYTSQILHLSKLLCLHLACLHTGLYHYPCFQGGGREVNVSCSDARGLNLHLNADSCQRPPPVKSGYPVKRAGVPEVML